MAKRTASGAASAASTESVTASAPATGEAGAGSAAPTDTTATGTPAADAAGAGATTSSTDSAAPAVESSEAPVRFAFPLNVVIRNHAGLAFSEPITGAFLPGGGSATVTLHDEEHAEQVSDSLRNIVETNYLAPGALAVEPA